MSSRSHYNSKSAGKVRRARTVVMFLLVAVAVAIILIDRNNEETPLEIPSNITANTITNSLASTDTMSVGNTVNTLPTIQNESVVGVNGQMTNPLSTQTTPSFSQPTVIAPPADSLVQNNVRTPEKTVVTSPAKTHVVSSVTKAKPETASNPTTLASGDKSVHIVQSGETLSYIAQKYYGKSSLWKFLLRANSLKNANLSPGQKIVLPTRKNLRTKTSPRTYIARSTASTQRKGKHEHIVQRGDTLTKISKTFGVSVVKIYDANRQVLGNNPNYLKEGLSLQIPVASRR